MSRDFYIKFCQTGCFAPGTPAPLITQFISHRLAGENLKGSTVTARAYLMGANLIDAGGL